jgi:hypothetical protein
MCLGCVLNVYNAYPFNFLGSVLYVLRLLCATCTHLHSPSPSLFISSPLLVYIFTSFALISTYPLYPHFPFTFSPTSRLLHVCVPMRLEKIMWSDKAEV